MTAYLDDPEAQERVQARLRELEEAAREQAKADLGAVLMTPAGRRFFWGLLVRAQVFSAQLSPDGMQAAHFEGRRALGVQLMTDAQDQHPQLYVLGLEEALQRAQEDAQQRRAIEGSEGTSDV